MKESRKHKRRESFLSAQLLGQSMFELVFSVAIATIILTGIVSLAAFSVRNSSSSRDNALANRYAGEAVEWLRGARDDYVTWADFVADRAGAKTWCFSVSPIMAWPTTADCTAGTDEINGNTIYLREAVLTTEDTVNTGDTVNATVTVKWTTYK